MDINYTQLYNDLINELIQKFGVVDRIEITGLPSNIDIDGLISDAIDNEYGKICPYCGSEQVSKSKYEHMYRRLVPWKFWQKKHRGFYTYYRCKSCGVQWKSPWYPDDLNKDMIECLKKYMRKR